MAQAVTPGIDGDRLLLRLEALNQGLAALIARGVLIAGVAPAQSALELEFHEAIAEVA